MKKDYIIDWLEAKAGKIPKVSTQLNISDKWGAIKVRWSIKRMSYTVPPGVYAVGKPTKDSIVLVSANYKLSFDVLRKELEGLNAWVMVLDTKGINVWCAAGKGTFGTDEIVNRIERTGLKKIVNHKRIILPQLSATGVAAHKVKKQSGFSVIYGPIRASDIEQFLKNGMKATPEMREVTFSFYDRLKLIGVELVGSFKILLISIPILLLLAILRTGGLSFETIFNNGIINILFACFAGIFLGPLFLPYWPGRAFSLKGIFPGLIFFALSFLLKTTGENTLEILSWMFLIPAISSFLLMNFTGASTYTSLSGVIKEMRTAIPLQIAFAVFGFSLLIINAVI